MELFTQLVGTLNTHMHRRFLKDMTCWCCLIFFTFVTTFESCLVVRFFHQTRPVKQLVNQQCARLKMLNVCSVLDTCNRHVFILGTTLLSSPPGSLVMLAASQGKLSSSCLTDCPCIAVLCVRYLPFVWHCLGFLAASCFCLASWEGYSAACETVCMFGNL